MVTFVKAQRQHYEQLKEKKNAVRVVFETLFHEAIGLFPRVSFNEENVYAWIKEKGFALTR